MTLTLLLLATPALATTLDNACVNATGAAAEACRCVFHSSLELDWTDPANPLEVENTCFDFKTIVNPIGNQQALYRMDQVAFHMGFISQRSFHYEVLPGPYVYDQYLDTMDMEISGLTDFLIYRRMAWADEDSWMVEDEHGAPLVSVIPDPELLAAKLVTVWQMDEDLDGDVDDLVMIWDDDRIWVAIDFEPGGIVEPPDPQE